MRSPALVFFLVVVQAPFLRAQDQPLELPVYRLTVDPDDLSSLYQAPRSDLRYPARFTFAGQSRECQVRFRGATARKFKKKSWKLWFEDRSNPLGAREVNLNAEYRDLSLMRNALAMKLFQFLGHPAPDTEHVSLVVNGDFLGVFVKVEEMNQDFLSRYGYEPGGLYKSENHGGSTAPLLNFDNYYSSWNKKAGDESDYTDMQRLFNQLFYLTHEDFENRISSIVDVDNALRYFAVTYAISSLDAVTKNTLLYFEPGGRLHQVMPWDHDASFGNFWTGEYRDDLETVFQHVTFRYHLLFQRLMEYDTWRESFWRTVGTVIDQGFSSVEAQIDSTYELIRSDVYQDQAKIGTNEDFDNEVLRLKGFLAARRSFLADFSFFEKNPLSDLYCSNPFPSPEGDDRGVVFRAASLQSQPIVVEYITDLSSFETWGEGITIEKLFLFDDGKHDDLEAGDLVYGNRLVLPENYTGLVPYAFRSGDYSYPQNGLFYINYKATKTFALNVNHAGIEEYRLLRIGDVYRVRDGYFIEITNTGEMQLDLSYCSFQSGEYFNRFVFPPETRIGAGESLILSSNRDAASGLFPDSPAIGNIYFEISPGDTMKLLTPALTVMTAGVHETYRTLEVSSPAIVINEINYHSADGMDTGDWVELYNPNDFFADLSGWNFQDGNIRHSFVLPEGTLIEPRGFLVLCQDGGALEWLSGTACTGDFDFGLRNSGELVRLFDRHGLQVDSIVYGDRSPWPEEADGDGSTLELRHYELDNSEPSNWMASISPGGTPGRVNSVYEPRGTAGFARFTLSEGIPNPFVSTVRLELDLAERTPATLKVYNAIGQLEEILADGVLANGINDFTWDPRGRGAGVYFIALYLGERLEAVRKAVYLGG